MSYETVVAGDSPRHWWKMDEASGDLTDSGSTAVTATAVSGTATYDQTDIGTASGGSIYFTGSTRFRATSTSVPQGDLTFEGLFRILSSSGNKHLFNAVDYNDVMARSGSGNMVFTNLYKGSYSTSLGTLATDTDYHFAFTFADPGGGGNPTIKAYLNGTLVDTQTTNPGALDVLTSFDIGNFEDNGRALNGRMQHLAIYTSALSVGTILAHADAAGLVPAAPITPAKIAAVTSIPAAALSTGSTKIATVIAATTTIPAASVAGSGATVTATVIAITTTVPIGVVPVSVDVGTDVTDASVSGRRVRTGIATVSSVPPIPTQHLGPIKRTSLTFPAPTLVNGRPV